MAWAIFSRQRGKHPGCGPSAAPTPMGPATVHHRTGRPVPYPQPEPAAGAGGVVRHQGCVVSRVAATGAARPAWVLRKATMVVCRAKGCEVPVKRTCTARQATQGPATDAATAAGSQAPASLKVPAPPRAPCPPARAQPAERPCAHSRAKPTPARGHTTNTRPPGGQQQAHQHRQSRKGDGTQQTPSAVGASGWTGGGAVIWAWNQSVERGPHRCGLAAVWLARGRPVGAPTLCASLS